MTDKFGETSIVEKDNFGQDDYNYNKPAYIHDLLVVGRDFTKKYLSAKHKKFFSGLQGYVPNVDNGISVSQLVPLMEKIQNYANDYQDILSFLKEESAPQEMIVQLYSEYNKVNSKYFKFGIMND